ncbi:MAG: MBOAT family protein [Lachnospiraceae bacterium]|nr:MBOAT family protein [Candidatus Colinaster equi]
MIFNSLNFLIFIIIVFLVYVLIPLKARKYWLLIASFTFYAWNGIQNILYLLGAIIITYICGRNIEKKCSDGKKNRAKIHVAIGVVVCIGMLFVLKYLDMFLNIGNRFIGSSLPALELVAPLGLSFFTLQAVGYLVDIYRGQISAEKNIVSYALFLSFFPQISSGPIARAGSLLNQINGITHIDIDVCKEGLFHIAYGLFLKMVVADNIGIVVDGVLTGWEEKTGMMLCLAIVLYGIQIYCDFHGYTTIAIGIAEVFGIKLMKNFRQPYLSTSVKEFWRNWHISLTSWFTDYLYIPLGGNRKGQLRKLVNMMIVFLVSGLWHGASAKYVVWGGLNGLFLVLESLLAPTCAKLCDKLKIDRNTKMYKLFKGLLTFALVDYAWLFFRADSFGAAIGMTRKMVSEFRLTWFLSQNCYDTFGSMQTLAIILISIIILILCDRYEKSGGNLYRAIASWQIVYRWLFYVLMLYVIISWGVYGNDYTQTRFIYFQF